MRDLNDSISSLISIGNSRSTKKIRLHGSFTKTTRNVSFSDQVEVLEISNRDDLSTTTESRSLWYSMEELNRVTDEVQWTIEMMENEEYCRRFIQDDVCFSACGLLRQKDLEARTEATKFVTTIVLQQIAVFKSHGLPVEDMTAKIYHDCAAPHVQKAEESAQLHAKDVMKYLSYDIRR